MAALTAVMMMIGGIIVGSSLAQTESVASSTSGMPVSHAGVDPNWRTINGWQAVWQVPLDEESLYWVINRTGSLAGGQVVLWAAYDWSAQMSTYSTQGVLRLEKTLDNNNGGTNLVGPVLSTAAMARIGGTKADPAAPLTVYFWDYEVQTTLGDLTCSSGSTPIVRATSEQEDLQWSCLPTPYGTRYSAGGEADQYTGNIYMIPGGGTIDDQSSSSTNPSAETNWRFVVWDPVSGSYSLSYSVQPGDWEPGMTTVPQERVKLHAAGDGSGDYNAQASYDISLDSDGNAYTYSGIDPANGGDGNMSIVRMEPARDESGNIVDGTNDNPWRYYVVTKIAREDPSQSWSAPSSIYGNGIMNGQLILGANTRVVATGLPATATAGGRGTTAMVRIDPQSAMASVVYSVDNKDLVVSEGYDNASSQGAEVIRGTLYQDVNGDGAITDGEPGLPNETVALYNGSGKLLSIQQTDSMGQYSFLIASVTGANMIFYIRPVDVTTLLPDGVTRVNGAQTWGAGSVATGLSVNKVPLVNTAEIQCLTEGGITSADGGPCSGARPTTSADPTVGALGTVSDPSTWLAYAKVTFNTGQYVPTADFGFTARGSFGDAPAGPLTSNVPMHANVPSTLWLGETLGSYAGPASEITAHASDDGVYLTSYAGNLGLQSTSLASGYTYQLGADLSGPAADHAYVAGWTTEAGTNTWNTTPIWTPVVADGKAAGNFSLSANGQVQLRVNASEQDISLPTNADKEYYGIDSWTTAGEIEDYGFTLADAVIRPAALTTKGETTATVMGQQISASTTVNVGDAIQATGGDEMSVSVSAPDQWLVAGITIKDTTSGSVLDSFPISPSPSLEFPYTPVFGSDVVIEAIFEPSIDLEASTLTLDKDSTTVGQDITATATIVDYLGDPVVGVTVDFDNASPETTLTGENGGKSCVTGNDGTCSVTITSTTTGAYPDEISASVEGDPFTGSPQSVEFTHGDSLNLSFAVTPSVDPLDESQTDWRDADGVDSYQGVLTVEDQYGNQVKDLTLTDIAFESGTGVRVSSITNHGDGTYSVSYTSTVASSEMTTTVSYRSEQVGEAQPIPFKAGGFDPTISTFEIIPIRENTCVADGNPCYTGVLTAMDEHGNKLPGLDVADIEFGASSTDIQITDVVDNGDGTYTVTYSSTTASDDTTASVTYQGTQIGDDEPIPFGPGIFDASASTFTVGPSVDPTDEDRTDWCPADGNPCYTGVLTAKDVNGNLIPDLPVDDISFGTSSDEVTISAIENTGNGTYTVRFSSRVGSSRPTASVTYDGTAIGTDQPIPFAYGEFSADESTFTLTPGVDPSDSDQTGWRAADGADYYTGVLTAKDASGTLLADLSLSDIDFTSSSVDVTITDIAYTGNGTYSVKFTSTVGSSAPTASVAYKDDTVGDPEPIPYVHEAFSPSQSTFQITPGVDPTDPGQDGWPAADGNESYMGVLTAKDGDGNLLAGLDIDELVFSSSAADVTISDVTYLGGGMYTVRYTSNVGSSEPTASVAYAGEQVGTHEPIPFAHGEFSAELSTFTVTPAVDPTDEDQTGWRAADGTSSYTGVLTAKDVNGTLVAGLKLSDVVFASSNPEVSLTDVTYLGAGKYAVDYTSTVGSSTPTASVTYAGTQVGTDEPIPFSSGVFSAESSTFTVIPEVSPSDPDQDGWRSANGTDYYTGVLTAKDASGTLLADLSLSDIRFTSSSVDVRVTEVTYTGNGTYTVRFTSPVGSSTPTASVTYDGQQVGGDEPIPFTHDEFSAANSTFQITPLVDPADEDQTDWRAPDGTQFYTGVLTAKDTDGDLMAGLTISDLVFTASSIDVDVSDVVYLGGGQYSVRFTSTVGSSTPTASVSYAGEQVGTTLPIPYAHGDFSAELSTFTVTPGVDPADPDQEGWRAADGTSSYTGVVIAKDTNGNPLAGLYVSGLEFTSSVADVIISDVTYLGHGVYTVTYTSFVGSSQPTASVTYGGLQVGGDEPIPFAHGQFSSDLSTFVVTPSADPRDTTQSGWRAADGTDAYAGILTARDEQGKLMAGLSMDDLVFASSSDDVTLSSVTYLAGGMYQVRYTSTVGSAAPTASVSYAGESVGTDEPIPYAHGPLSADTSTFVVGPVVDPTDPDQTNWRAPDGTEFYTGILTAKDADGVLIADLDVSDLVFTSTDSDVTVSEVTYTGHGTYTVTYTSTVGSASPMASVTYQDTRVGEPQPIPFQVEQVVVPSEPDLMASSWVVTPIGPLVVGTDPANAYTATATILDKDGRPIEGVQVSFDITGSGPVFVDGSTCETTTDGTCHVVLTSTVAGTYPVTAVTQYGALTNTETSGAAASVTWNADQACVTSAGCDPDSAVPANHRTRTEVTKDNQRADGTAEDIVTVYVYDRWGNPVPDVVVDDPSSSGGSARTSEDGVATITYTSTVAGSQTTNVSIGDIPVEQETLQFVPGPVCTGNCVPKGAGTDPDKQTRIIIVTNDALVDDDDSVAVYAFDEYGNPIDGQEFTFVTDDPDLRFAGSDQSRVTVVTDEKGAGTWNVTSPVAGTHLVRVYVDDAEIPGSPLELRFVGPPTITGPSDGETLTSNKVTITGTGQTDGDTIIVTENGVEVCTAEVHDGVWSCEATLSDGDHSVIAVEKTADGTQSDTSSVVSFTIDTSVPVQSASPSETSVSPSPSETSVSPSPSETSVSPSPSETSVSPSPSETSASPSPSETSTSPSPSETSTSPSPSETSTSPSPSPTSASTSPTSVRTTSSETPTPNPSETTTVPLPTPSGSETIQPSSPSTGATSVTMSPTPSQTPLTPHNQASTQPPGGQPVTTIPTGGAADDSSRLLGLVTGLMVATIGLWVGVKVSRRHKEGGR